MKVVLSIILCMLLLTGCWDKVDLNDRAFVIMLAIDKYTDEEEADSSDTSNETSENPSDKPSEKKVSTVHKPEGVTPRFTVSLALPDLAALAGTGSSDSKTQAVRKSADRTVSGAFGITDAYSSQKMYFGHLKAAILGEEILSDEERFREAVDAMERNPAISRSVILFASDGKANEVLEADSPGEPLVGMFVSHFVKNNARSSSVIFKQDLEQTVRQLRATGSTIMPRISVDGGDIRLSAAAVIKDYRLAGWLSDIETRGYLWLNGSGKTAQVQGVFRGREIVLSVNSSKYDISFKEMDGHIMAVADVQVGGSLVEYYLGADGIADVEKEFTEIFETIIKSEIEAAINKMHLEYETDGFDFLGMIRKSNYALYKKYGLEQAKQGGDAVRDALAHLEVSVNVSVNLKSAGVL